MYNDRHIFEREREENRELIRFFLKKLHKMAKNKERSELKFKLRRMLINV